MMISYKHCCDSSRMLWSQYVRFLYNLKARTGRTKWLPFSRWHFQIQYVRFLYNIKARTKWLPFSRWHFQIQYVRFLYNIKARTKWLPFGRCHFQIQYVRFLYNIKASSKWLPFGRCHFQIQYVGFLYNIKSRTKWLPFGRWHFQIHWIFFAYVTHLSISLSVCPSDWTQDRFLDISGEHHNSHVHFEIKVLPMSHLVIWKMHGRICLKKLTHWPLRDMVIMFESLYFMIINTE